MTIMAERLKIVLKEIIHLDQNGFLPKRQIRNNTRTVMNILEYYEAHPEKPVALDFLDVQKAFDNLNWEFFLYQMKEMKFGPNFVKMIKEIYSNQKASAKVNGDFTERFYIAKRLRQGCPISPLIFILAIEVLLNQIRNCYMR
uniref:Reverse transcriptase domain-containing protein n=1 Tax=Micrurus surinamensis TaxID=129470 RepID=A0A2D4PG53_MICSU